MRTTRRLAAILAADIAGYSAAMERDEEGTAAAVRALRQEVIEPKLTEHQGRLIKTTGDGFLAEFASPIAALNCALAIQQRPDESSGLQLRIGLNLGDVIIEEGGDVLGEGVNIAARLESLAEPGGILISGKVHTEVDGKVEATFEDRGELQVKNISKSVRAYAVRSGELVIASIVTPGTSLPLPDKPSIAVLPFQNMSGDPEQEYFADGIVEDITTALSRFKSLFVIARNSSFTFKGKAIDIRQVGHQLGVRYVLEGSVRRAGNRIRITGQLIEAATVTHLWADKFEGTLDDIFQLQDQVSSGVVGVVAPTIVQAEIERAKRKPTANLRAYDYYLRGIARVDRLTREDNEEALRLFLKAIEIDPGFSAAMARACVCYNQRVFQGWLTDKEHDIAQALRWAKTSLEVGKDDALVLATAALTLGFFPNDTSIEFRHALSEQALRLNPNLAIAWYRSGYDKIFQGDHGLAITHFFKVLQLNPLDRYSLHAYTYMTGLAAAYFFNGQNEEAERWAQRSLDGNPNLLPTLRLMVAIKAALFKDTDAKQCARRLLEINPAETIGDMPTYRQLSRLEDRQKWFEALQSAGIPA